MKIRQKTPNQETPIYENVEKKHPKKNTNFQIWSKKHQLMKHQFWKMVKKTPKKNTQKKHLPDYHWGGVH